ncbi:MAG: hypothetical protein LQ342_006677, partial [Letrouitia transgressa]
MAPRGRKKQLAPAPPRTGGPSVPESVFSVTASSYEGAAGAMIPPFTIGAASAPVPRYAEAKGERTETRPTAALVTTDGGSLSTGLDQDPVDVARA